MGYFRDSHSGHEGHAVGFVIREGCSEGSGLYRELGYPDDEKTGPVVLIAAGCECGWRSPRFKPEWGADWSPYIVNTSERDDKKIRDLWAKHLEHTPA